MIGCAFGLDTPNSVYNMVNFFSEVGITKAISLK